MSVVFRNLKGYDGHHLMRYGLANKLNWDLKPIYQSGDKLLGVIVRIPPGLADEVEEAAAQEEEEEEEEECGADEAIEATPRKRRKEYYTITFIDSFQFLPSSLEKLIEALPDTPISRHMLAKAYGLSEEDGRRISKGVFPYTCLLYTSPSPRDGLLSRMPSSA